MRRFRPHLVDALVVLLVLIMGGCVATVTAEQYDTNLYRWQTLISGILAVVAASASIYYLRKQIMVATEVESTRREARLDATWVNFPNTLAEIRKYCRAVFRYLKAKRSKSDEGDMAARLRRLAPEALSTETMEQLVRVTEATHDPEGRRLLIRLTTEMEILNSSLKNVRNYSGRESGPNPMFEVAACYAAKICSTTKEIETIRVSPNFRVEENWNNERSVRFEFGDQLDDWPAVMEFAKSLDGAVKDFR